VLTRLRPRHAADGGYTLIELLVVMMLMTVVGTMVTTGLVSSMRAARRGQNRTYTTADVSRAVERMSKQLRAATPLVSGSATAVSAETYHSNVRYRYTYTYTSATGTITETVARYASATAVSPSSTTTSTLIKNVTGSATMFAYYDRDNVVVDPATSLRDVARIVIAVTAKPSEQQPISVSTDVYLRNFTAL
jgi:prepilin-type N-terminal cleavage/methylation domain-containing protein